MLPAPATPPIPAIYALTAARADGLPEYLPRAGLPNFIARARAGKPVSIGYLGGSITDMDGWRSLSEKWIQARYPAAKITGFNAAVPGTGSDLGVFRLDHDVLLPKPDLLFVEFAVNDVAAPPERVRAAMEGIVCKVWRALPRTDICFVYTLTAGQTATYRAGKLPPATGAMESVADNYGIPSIAFGVSVARLEGEGKLIFTGAKPPPAGVAADKIIFSPDGTHPYTDLGHPLYKDAIARAFPLIEAAGAAASPHSLPAPLSTDNWSAAKVLLLDDTANVTRMGSWKRLDAAADPRFREYARALPQLWSGGAGGDSLVFRFSGSVFGLCGLKGPDTGQFTVAIDGGKPVMATFFDSYSLPGHWRIKPWWYPGALGSGGHTATLTILPTPPDKAKLIGKPLAATGDPAAFDGSFVYLSGALAVPSP